MRKSREKMSSLRDCSRFELVAEFYSFLLKRQCLESYLRLAKRFQATTVGYFLSSTHPEKWIAAAFLYHCSDEGFYFWNHIAYEWNVFLNKSHL